LIKSWSMFTIVAVREFGRAMNENVRVTGVTDALAGPAVTPSSATTLTTDAARQRIPTIRFMPAPLSWLVTTSSYRPRDRY
jgi:hypothetical protein